MISWTQFIVRYQPTSLKPLIDHRRLQLEQRQHNNRTRLNAPCLSFKLGSLNPATSYSWVSSEDFFILIFSCLKLRTKSAFFVACYYSTVICHQMQIKAWMLSKRRGTTNPLPLGMICILFLLAVSLLNQRLRSRDYKKWSQTKIAIVC